MPCDYRKYPENWFSEIRPAILKRAGNCCEGIDRFPKCFAINGEFHPDTGSRVVLTIAHMNHDIEDNRPENLRALCQKITFHKKLWNVMDNRPENLRALCQRCHNTHLCSLSTCHVYDTIFWYLSTGIIFLNRIYSFTG